MDGWLAAFVLSGALTAIVLLFLATSRKPVKCPSCGREQPKMRSPANLDQAMWGGFTCVGCGAEMDARGRLKAK